VRINDRGPFVGTRLIDLSKRSADALAFRHKGKTKVRVQWIGNAPLNDKGDHLAMMNRKAAEGSSIRTLIAAADGNSQASDTVQVASTDDGDVPTLQPAKRLAETKSRQKGPSIIQIGSFRSLDGAEQARATLSAIGPVQVYEWESAEGPLFKVQMGPFHSRVGASDALNAVQAQGYDRAKLEAATIEQVAYNH
jgi:rare lipoprotein A